MLVLSFHIIWHALLFVFPTEIKTLLHVYDPYITFNLRYKYAMFLGARTYGNAMMHNIEICIL